MPQMSPMNWLILSLYFLLIYFIFMLVIYFFFYKKIFNMLNFNLLKKKYLFFW